MCDAGLMHVLHVGTTLKKVDNPDKVEVLKVDRRKLPSGRYRQAGFETRQEFDIEISRVVTEYRAQVLKDDNGTFPDQGGR
jgi:transposase